MSSGEIKQTEIENPDGTKTVAIMADAYPAGGRPETAPPPKELPEDIPKHILELMEAMITSLDGPVYCLRGLPPDFRAALGAKPSRTGLPVRRIIYNMVKDLSEGDAYDLVFGIRAMERLTAREDVQTLHRKFTRGGHVSIGKLASGIVMGIDGISLLTAEKFRRNRVGTQEMMRATRNQKDFLNKGACLQNLFSDRDPEENLDFRYTRFTEAAFGVARLIYKEVRGALLERFPYNPELPAIKELGMSETEYKKFIRYRALDNARYFIPVTALTSIYVDGNAMGLNNLMQSLYNSALPQEQLLASMMHAEATKVSPGCITPLRPNRQDAMEGFTDPDFVRMRGAITKWYENYVDDKVRQERASLDARPVSLGIDQKALADTAILDLMVSAKLAQALGFSQEYVYNWLRYCVEQMETPLPRFQDSIDMEIMNHVDNEIRILTKSIGEYQEIPGKEALGEQLYHFRNRDVRRWSAASKMHYVAGFEKLSREFERTNFTLDLVMDFGQTRDFQTHKYGLSFEPWLLVPNLGWSKPPEWDLLSDTTRATAEAVFGMSVDLWSAIAKSYKEEPASGMKMAQYAGLNCWNVRTHIRTNLRQIDHICQQRTTFFAHTAYRDTCLAINKMLIEIWPKMGKILRINGADNRYLFGPFTAKMLEANASATDAGFFEV